MNYGTNLIAHSDKITRKIFHFYIIMYKFYSK